MKIIHLLLIVCFTSSLQAQNVYRKKKKKSDFFGGARDVRDLRSYGLQITVGPNYTFTKLKNETHESDPAMAQRFNYTQDPMGSFGGFIDIGMVHYRMKAPKLKFMNGKNLIHYVDWGIGFDYIGGKEKTTVNNIDALGNVVSTVEGNGNFYNGYAYGRFTAHRLKKLSEKTHLDYALGLNGNYAVMGQNKGYAGAVILESQRFQQPFQLQIHAQLGINIKLRRGDYLVPGIWAPVLGLAEWNKGKPTIQWYSSNYFPVHAQLKWLHNFAKKSKNGCNTGSDSERKKNDEYMQNK